MEVRIICDPEESEVIECPNDIEEALQTIQLRKEKVTLNGEATSRLARTIHASKFVASTDAGGVRGTIGVRADEVLTEAPSEEVWSVCDSDPEDVEVIECAVDDEIEIVNCMEETTRGAEQDLCCSKCAGEEWSLRLRCCDDAIHVDHATGKQPKLISNQQQQKFICN